MRLAKGQLGRLSVSCGPAIVTDRPSSVAEFAHRDATFSIKPEDESMSDEILCAYHRAIARHQERTGVSYPFTRSTYIDEDTGQVHSTNSAQLVATFKFDAAGRIRITLV